MKAHGFTFIEVLVAMLIFVLVVLASVEIVHGSVRATREAKEYTVATQLLQKVMVDLETQVETGGFDKGCDKKKDGKFEAPHDQFSWATSCDVIEMNLSSSASQILAADNEADTKSTTENQMQKIIFDTASKYMTQAVREIHAEVTWMQGDDLKMIDLTTHVARYDQPLILGSATSARPTP